MRRWSGARAKEARLEAGFDRPGAAERIGVHLASVYRWEAGTEPQLRHASALADLYGITLDSLFVHDGSNGNCPDASLGKPDRRARSSSQNPTAAHEGA